MEDPSLAHDSRKPLKHKVQRIMKAMIGIVITIAVDWSKVYVKIDVH